MLKTAPLIVLILFGLLCSLDSSVADSYFLSHNRYQNLSLTQRKELAVKTMELMVELEAKYAHEVRKQGFNLNRYKEYMTVLNQFEGLLFSSAHAAPGKKTWNDFGSDFSRLISTPDPNRCLYAGWVSKMDGRYCRHPAFLPKGSSEFKAYQTENKCSGLNQITCNPAIFGYKQQSSQSLFCVPAGLDTAHNSALQCMKEALKETQPGGDSKADRLKFLVENLKKNPQIVESVHKFVYKTCVCPTTDKVNKNYHDYMRPHRTCYGLMNMMRESFCEDDAIIDLTLFRKLQNAAIPANAPNADYDGFYKSFLTEVESNSTEYKALCGEDKSSRDDLTTAGTTTVGTTSGATTAGTTSGTTTAGTSGGTTAGTTGGTTSGLTVADGATAGTTSGATTAGTTGGKTTLPVTPTTTGTTTTVTPTVPTTPDNQDGPDIIVTAPKYTCAVTCSGAGTGCSIQVKRKSDNKVVETLPPEEDINSPENASVEVKIKNTGSDLGEHTVNCDKPTDAGLRDSNAHQCERVCKDTQTDDWPTPMNVCNYKVTKKSDNTPVSFEPIAAEENAPKNSPIELKIKDTNLKVTCAPEEELKESTDHECTRTCKETAAPNVKREGETPENINVCTFEVKKKNSTDKVIYEPIPPHVQDFNDPDLESVAMRLSGTKLQVTCKDSTTPSALTPDGPPDSKAPTLTLSLGTETSATTTIKAKLNDKEEKVEGYSHVFYRKGAEKLNLPKKVSASGTSRSDTPRGLARGSDSSDAAEPAETNKTRELEPGEFGKDSFSITEPRSTSNYEICGKVIGPDGSEVGGSEDCETVKKKPAAVVPANMPVNPQQQIRQRSDTSASGIL